MLVVAIHTLGQAMSISHRWSQTRIYSCREWNGLGGENIKNDLHRNQLLVKNMQHIMYARAKEALRVTIGTE